MSPLPPAPWSTFHIDFCGPFPTGEHVLVVIDAYTTFPKVTIIKSTSDTAFIAPQSAKDMQYWHIKLCLMYGDMQPISMIVG